MIRNLKALGLMAVAAFAMSAMFASAAQAQKGTFTAGKTTSPPTNPHDHTTSTLHGEQYLEGAKGSTNYFEAVPGSGTRTECEKATFTGTSTGTSTTLTMAPVYTHCEAGGLPATVTMNGCDYTFTQPETIAGGKYTGKADLWCPPNKVIEVHVYLFGGVTTHSVNVCTLTVFPATPPEEVLGGHVIYTNSKNPATGKDDVTVNATVDKISWSQHGSCGATSGKDAIYRNTVTVTGKDPVTNEPHDVWISD